ncbi:hypothetical protein, partial [Escherichia coli]|uniref:hypothetical protein n=1 Tax=Escherichia coli TaxID=562 RepID=UPI001954F373
FNASSIALAMGSGESSINIEGGLGTTSVMIVFIVSSFSSILLLPIIIDFLGPKFAIILGLE